jgi:hypothetical protein
LLAVWGSLRLFSHHIQVFSSFVAALKSQSTKDTLRSRGLEPD